MDLNVFIHHVLIFIVPYRGKATVCTADIEDGVDINRGFEKGFMNMAVGNLATVEVVEGKNHQTGSYGVPAHGGFENK